MDIAALCLNLRNTNVTDNVFFLVSDISLSQLIVWTKFAQLLRSMGFLHEHARQEAISYTCYSSKFCIHVNIHVQSIIEKTYYQQCSCIAQKYLTTFQIPKFRCWLVLFM